jgi:hypothetical protein
MVTEKLKLTAMETNILHHRLEVPDAICDVLDGQWDLDAIEICCDELIKGNFTRMMRDDPVLCEAVLRDAVEGSTYWACCYSDCQSKLQLANVARACESLARKVGDFLGDKYLDCPTH